MDRNILLICILPNFFLISMKVQKSFNRGRNRAGSQKKTNSSDYLISEIDNLAHRTHLTVTKSKMLLHLGQLHRTNPERFNLLLSLQSLKHRVKVSCSLPAKDHNLKPTQNLPQYLQICYLVFKTSTGCGFITQYHLISITATVLL